MARWTVAGPQRVTVPEPVRRLNVNLISGRLNVVATDGPVRVEVTRVSRKPLIVECRDGVLSVRHERVRQWPGFLWWLGHLGQRYRVDISIAVPPDAAAALTLIDGSVVASGLASAADVNVTSGRITLLGMQGQTNAKLVSGPVEALGVGGELSMETVSGELLLADSTASRVQATTVSGPVTCDLDNPTGSEIRLNTTSGDITVRVREDSDLAVHLHTTSGRLTSAFPDLPVETGPWSVKTLQGMLGGGAGKLWANSTSGNIALLARPVEDLS